MAVAATVVTAAVAAVAVEAVAAEAAVGVADRRQAEAVATPVAAVAVSDDQIIKRMCLF